MTANAYMAVGHRERLLCSRADWWGGAGQTLLSELPQLRVDGQLHGPQHIVPLVLPNNNWQATCMHK